MFRLSAEIPTGYYNSAVGKTGAALKTQLYSITSSGYQTKTYDDLYTIYETSDRTPSGKIWDMYSTCTWDFGSGTCGNYSAVCDCYNREHSIPQSWFNEASPMKSDAFHVYPTDGKVNGQRSNFPFGECANGTSLSSNAKGKLGTSTFPGYSGTVFEPADEYKGDFARTYFYFATRYENIMTSIGGDSFRGNVYPALSDWSVNLFLKWHRQDPVSQKEIDRNNAIYVYQKNRNPFIDYPELAEYIWGNKMGTNWTLNPTTDPILYSPSTGSSVDFGTVKYKQTIIKTVSVLGSNLTGDLTVTLSGPNASYFTIPTKIPKDYAQAGYEITIWYYAPEVGTHNATLTISGGGVSDVTVNITATAANCVDFNFSAPFTSDMTPFSQYNISGDQVWTWKSAAYGVAMSGYAFSANHVNEDWLITNEMDLSDFENLQLTFSHAINKGDVSKMKNENTVWISNDFHYGNPTSATWTQLTIPIYPTGSDWTFVNSGNITIPADKCQSNSFIGFKYISTLSASSTWEIKNLNLIGNCTSTSVPSIRKKNIHKIYSENRDIIISNLDNEDVIVFDIYGKKVFAQKNTNGEIKVDSCNSGVFIVKAGDEVQKIIVR